MAIATVKIGDAYNSPIHQEFLVDGTDDISSLPGIDSCAPGSTASIVGGGTYVLSPEGTWTVQSNTASGGATGSTTTNSNIKLIYSGEITASYTSSSGDPLLTPEYTQATSSPYSALYAVIEDTAGQREGYFYKSETVMAIASDATTTAARGVVSRHVNSSGSVVTNSYGGSAVAYGIFISSFAQSGTLKVYARYSSDGSGIINGTYKVRVYAIVDPGVS